MASKRANASQRSGYRPRVQGTRDLRKRFLILCEGSKTEPNYFAQFAASADIYGLANDPLRLVQEAMRRRDKAARNKNPYDETWCVFDRDDFPLERFNQAISLAREKDIKIAYSNEAFELWYYLHYDYCDTACHRTEYSDRLTVRLGFKYNKNDPAIYSVLASRQAVAIRRAETLAAQYDPPDPANDNPSTTVHLLVKELNKSSRP